MAHKTFRDRRGVQSAVPYIGDIAGEQGPGGSPVGLVVVTDLSASGRPIHPQAMTPSRVVFDPIGRVGDHEFGCQAAQQRGDRTGVGTVATANAVRSRQPDISDCGHGFFG